MASNAKHEGKRPKDENVQSKSDVADKTVDLPSTTGTSHTSMGEETKTANMETAARTSPEIEKQWGGIEPPWTPVTSHTGMGEEPKTANVEKVAGTLTEIEKKWGGPM